MGENGNGDKPEVRAAIAAAIKRELRTVLTVAVSVLGAAGACVPIYEHLQASREAAMQAAIAQALEPLELRLAVLETRVSDMNRFAREHGYNDPDGVAAGAATTNQP